MVSAVREELSLPRATPRHASIRCGGTSSGRLTTLIHFRLGSARLAMAWGGGGGSWYVSQLPCGLYNCKLNFKVDNLDYVKPLKLARALLAFYSKCYFCVIAEPMPTCSINFPASPNPPWICSYATARSALPQTLPPSAIPPPPPSPATRSSLVARAQLSHIL